jgi:hypothetical protein
LSSSIDIFPFFHFHFLPAGSIPNKSSLLIFFIRTKILKKNSAAVSACSYTVLRCASFPSASFAEYFTSDDIICYKYNFQFHSYTAGNVRTTCCATALVKYSGHGMRRNDVHRSTT